jgi:gliding motility-associated lipoprotein GldD
MPPGNLLLVFLLLLFIASCNSPYVPKPRGYFKIEFPDRKYQVFNEPGYPYTFEYPVYASITKDSLFFEENPDNPYWINIDYPQFSGRVYLSYKSIGGTSVYKTKTAMGYKDSLVRNTFDGLKDEAYRMTYKHTLKATSIEDSGFITPNHVAGVYFSVGGNAATSKQFYVSDTGKHFLRGALYFDSAPNEDSLGIVNRFLQEDMKHLINTLKWK